MKSGPSRPRKYGVYARKPGETEWVQVAAWFSSRQGAEDWAKGIRTGDDIKIVEK